MKMATLFDITLIFMMMLMIVLCFLTIVLLIFTYADRLKKSKTFVNVVRNWGNKK